MIRFPCRCGFVLEAPADLAGAELQCPQCHLLNSVPRISDLQSMSPDGLYKLDAPDPLSNPSHNLSDLLKVYARQKVDADGRPIDLRNTPAELDGIDDYALASQAPAPPRPRYDPETGELVRPIPIAKAPQNDQPPVDPQQIPFARAVVGYAGTGAGQSPNASFTFLALMQPTNVITMGFVLLVHLSGWGMFFLTNRGLIFLAPIALAIVLVIFAHYGNTVDEIATEDRDEVPRLMRDLRFGEDVWRPIFGVFCTLIFCYGPAIWVLAASLPQPALAIVLAGVMAAVGTLLVPALLLTLLTSGSLANLRPDRVVSVMVKSGKPYFSVTMLFVAAMIPYALALGLSALSMMAAPPVNVPTWLTSWLLLFPLFCAAIYLMHLFCWRLGLIYRECHNLYSWVGRFHIRERTPVLRRKRVYVKPDAEIKTPHDE